MSRGYELVLEDIADAAARIIRFTETRQKPQDLFSDEMAVGAILYNLEVIGEAAKKVPQSIRGKYPEVDWRRIAGMRDRLIHHYHDVDEDVVWEVVKKRIPVLREQVLKILSELAR